MPSAEAASPRHHRIFDLSGCDPAALSDTQALAARAASVARDAIVAVEATAGRGGRAVVTALWPGGHLCVVARPADRHATITCAAADEGTVRRVERRVVAALEARERSAVSLVADRAAVPSLHAVGHRRFERVVCEVAPEHLPEGVGVQPAGERGLGLFAARPFPPGAHIGEVIERLVSHDTLFEITTPAGTTSLMADELGFELTVDALVAWTPAVLDALARHYGVPVDDAARLHYLVTDGERREVLISTWGGLMNHGSPANVTDDRDGGRVEFVGGEWRWHIQLVAARAIAAGDELTWDYGSAPGYLPPEAWR